MDIRITPIEANCFYHIYNRGVNSEVIFRSDRNYLFFLEKIREHLLPVSEIYAFCLMANHFHILVRIKSDEVLRQVAQSQQRSVHIENVGLHSPQHIFSKQFSRIFNSYSQAFNKENNRHGALIESPFKRKHITSEDYLRQCIIYIHQNPVSADFTKYSYSSYKTLLSTKPTSLCREEVIGLFEDKSNFVACHRRDTDYRF